MNKPIVTVIIPTYKRTKFIKRAVQSVLDQTYDNIEILIVDDNIKDSKESQYIKINVETMDDRIRVIKTKGQIGGGKARNMGVLRSTGSYIAFLDDDDVFLPEKIEKQLEFMMKYNYDMSIQDVEWYDENEKLVEHRTFDFIKSDKPEYMLKQHILHSLCPTAIYMITKEAFFKTKGFGQTSMGQDFRFMLSCCTRGLRIGYMKGAYVHQYLHSGERISIGNNKIEGEKALFAIKSKYLSMLSPKERKYVKFRHFAVLMFTYIRSNQAVKAIPYAIAAFVTSPSDTLLESKRYFGGRMK
ncbi:Glycosyl transferase family 2 [Lachnospiraceae bacterium RM5]|nr:Glycosyl transferase family 2 [Lachnospiraceae bacterium RM5]